MSTTWLLRRGGKKSGFRYLRPDGRAEKRPSVLARISALGVPPGWSDVHVAAAPRSAVQAWGMDVKGRKQYRYHDTAVAMGALRKYHRVRRLAVDLPDIRKKLERDFRSPAHSRRRVLAGAVRLIETGFFRVGSERYAIENRTFGLSTLRKSHVVVENDLVAFSYTGKRSVKQRQIVTDRRLAKYVKEQIKTPGTRLFRYQEGKHWSNVTAEEVNEYIRSLTRRTYTAKDFRTWGGTLRAAIALAEIGKPSSERDARKNATMVVRLVAAELGNTPTICRKSYVHPIVLARYMDDGDVIALRPHAREHSGHAPEERALIRFLAQHFPERRKGRPKARTRERREELLGATR